MTVIIVYNAQETTAQGLTNYSECSLHLNNGGSGGENVHGEVNVHWTTHALPICLSAPGGRVWRLLYGIIVMEAVCVLGETREGGDLSSHIHSPTCYAVRGSLCAVIVLLVVAVVEPQACQARSAHRILRSTHRGVWGVQRGQQHQLESRSVNLSDQQETMVNNPGKQDLEVAGLVKGNDTFSTMAVRVSDVNATQSLGIMVNGDNTTGILTKKERNGRVNRQVVIISKKAEMEKRGAKEGRGLNGDRETEVEKGGKAGNAQNERRDGDTKNGEKEEETTNRDKRGKEEEKRKDDGDKTWENMSKKRHLRDVEEESESKEEDSTIETKKKNSRKKEEEEEEKDGEENKEDEDKDASRDCEEEKTSKRRAKSEDKENKTDDKKEEKTDDKKEEKTDDKKEEKPDDKKEQMTDDKKKEKTDDKKEEKTDDKKEEKTDDKKEEKPDDKKEQMTDDKKKEKTDDKKEEKTDDKKEEKIDDKKEEKIDDKKEEKIDDKKQEKIDDKKEEKTDDKEEERTDDKKEEEETIPPDRRQERGKGGR
ncbi:cylicin-2 isoform X1 [Cherax quadricarinatus]